MVLGPGGANAAQSAGLKTGRRGLNLEDLKTRISCSARRLQEPIDVMRRDEKLEPTHSRITSALWPNREASFLLCKHRPLVALEAAQALCIDLFEQGQ